jgi:hypothetical protein
MTELVEIERTAEADQGPPVAHLAPVGPNGERAALCGAVILGIHVGNLPYVLCEECERLSRSHPRYRGFDG